MVILVVSIHRVERNTGLCSEQLLLQSTIMVDFIYSCVHHTPVSYSYKCFSCGSGRFLIPKEKELPVVQHSTVA